MNLILSEKPEAANARLRDENGNLKPLSLAQKDTALAAAMGEMETNWLLRHVIDRWTKLYSGLETWRLQMAKWEKMSKMDYSDRIAAVDPNKAESVRDVFSYQNDTLGMSEGFVDFAVA